MGKVDKNKQQKRTSLLETAFSLFTSRGIHNTSISDIVERAGVAKGTFYLYFPQSRRSFAKGGFFGICGKYCL